MANQKVKAKDKAQVIQIQNSTGCNGTYSPPLTLEDEAIPLKKNEMPMIIKDRLVWMSIAFVLIAAAGLYSVVEFGDTFSNHNTFYIVYYFMLCALGLCAALVLFGVLRSYARTSGTQLGFKIEAGGAAALFIIVLLLGWMFIPTPDATFTVTVFVHGPGGQADMPLRNQGKVFLDLGGKRDVVAIGESGQAVFTEVPGRFRGKPVTAGVIHDVWALSPECQSPVLKPGEGAYLSIVPKVRTLEGKATDSTGLPVIGAQVVFGNHSATTDEHGRFSIPLPATDNREQEISIIAHGYRPWSSIAVPGSGPINAQLER